MNKLFNLFIAFAALALTACKAEFDDPTVNPEIIEHESIRLETVKVNLVGESGEEDTKSVVSTDVEGFVDAYLFAFWSDSKKICTYTDGGKQYPVAKYISDKSFEWALPVGKDSNGKEQHIDIWVVVNPKDDICSFLDNAIDKGTDLTEDKLAELEYRCDQEDDLEELGMTGMPMSGMLNDLYLPKSDTPFSLTIRRLFARYDIKLDYTDFINAGWNVQAVSIQSYNVNTSVPYFYTGSGTGYRQTDYMELDMVDHATSNDLATINTKTDGKSTDFITFYALENCQGEILKDDGQPASSWVSVDSELSEKLQCCSYLLFNVKAISSDKSSTRTFPYKLYLGQDFKSNFDIIRNKRKKVTIRIGDPSSLFAWANSKRTVAKKRETKREYVVSTYAKNEFVAKPDFIKGNVNFKQSFDCELKSDELGKLYYEITPLDSAPEGDFVLRAGNRTLSVSDSKPFSVQPDYYAGFNLGKLPLTSSLGYPCAELPEVKYEDLALYSPAQEQKDYLRCVYLPDKDTNPYLWEGTSATYSGWMNLEESLYDKYDVKLQVDCANTVGNSIRLAGVLDQNDESPRFFYEGLPGVDGSNVPAHCKVLIHAKEDLNDEWVTWFEFDRLPQFECGLSLETSNTGSSFTYYEETWWTGAVSFKFYEVGEGEVGTNQPGYYYFTDLHPETHYNVYIPNRAKIYSYLQNNVFTTADFGTEDYYGIRGYNTTIDVFWQQQYNPVFVLQWSLPDHMNGLGIENDFPHKFTPIFMANTKPFIPLDLKDISGAISSNSDFVVLPSEYLTEHYGNGNKYPGYILFRSNENWHFEAEHVYKDPKDFVPKRPDMNDEVFSNSYYLIELYPDADYIKNPFSHTGVLSVERHYLTNYGLKISTIKKDNVFPIDDISYDGNGDYATVNGNQVKIENVIDAIRVNYTEHYEGIDGRVKGKPKNLVLQPVKSNQISFTWNNYAASGYVYGYREKTVYGRPNSPDNRGHISLTGWKVGTSFVPTLYTHNPWDDFMSFSVTFKNGYGGYSKNGKHIEHKKQFVFQEPAVGAK